MTSHLLTVSIDSVISTDFPIWVLVDAHGETHEFHEKLPVVSSRAECIEKLPGTGAIRCEVFGRERSGDVVLVTAATLDGVDSKAGVRLFLVRKDQVVTIEEDR